jgi:hypothetical protein
MSACTTLSSYTLPISLAERYQITGQHIFPPPEIVLHMDDFFHNQTHVTLAILVLKDNSQVSSWYHHS